MYVPRHFEESRVEVLHELIRRHPLATLVAVTPEGPEASHVPFELDIEPQPFGTLRCHLARANPLWRQLAADKQVLVVFQGAESYISPAWYASKKEHGKVVPTWDYVTVHAHGVPTVTHDAQWLRTLVETLTNRHEQGRPDPWHVSDAPADYVEKMLAAIVGVEIPVQRLVGNWKLSQNRSAADREGVIAGLERDGAAPQLDVASLIKRTL
jgi:transcriptional regulator